MRNELIVNAANRAVEQMYMDAARPKPPAKKPRKPRAKKPPAEPVPLNMQHPKRRKPKA